MKRASILLFSLGAALGFSQATWTPEVVWSNTNYRHAKFVPGQNLLIVKRVAENDLAVVNSTDGSFVRALGPAVLTAGRNSVRVTPNYVLATQGIGGKATVYRISDGTSTQVANVAAHLNMNLAEDKILVCTNATRSYTFPGMQLIRTFNSNTPFQAAFSPDDVYISVIVGETIGENNSRQIGFNANTGALIYERLPDVNVRNLETLPDTPWGFITNGPRELGGGASYAFYFDGTQNVPTFGFSNSSDGSPGGPLESAISAAAAMVYGTFLRRDEFGGGPVLLGGYDYAHRRSFGCFSWNGLTGLLGYGASNDGQYLLWNADNATALVKSPFTTRANARPILQRVRTGFLNGGNIFSTEYPDRDYYIARNGGPVASVNGPTIVVEFEGENPFDTVSGLSLNVNHKESVNNMKGRVELFDWVSDNWSAQAGTFNTLTTSQNTTVTVTDPGRFVRANDRRVRCRVTMSPPATVSTYTMSVNEVRWDFTK